MSKTNFLETQILNHVLRNVPYSAPATVYVALFTATPDETGGGTEVSGGAYARQAVTFAAPSPDSVTNTADILFPVATANWGTVTHFAIMDALTAGNMLYYSALTTARSVLVDDQFRFPAGQLEVQEE